MLKYSDINALLGGGGVSNPLVARAFNLLKGFSNFAPAKCFNKYFNLDKFSSFNKKHVMPCYDTASNPRGVLPINENKSLLSAILFFFLRLKKKRTSTQEKKKERNQNAKAIRNYVSETSLDLRFGKNKPNFQSSNPPILTRLLCLFASKPLDIKKPIFRPAFTLAEVLVSLMIIGVIGSVVIPALSNNRPKENKIMYRKAYGVISRTVASLMETEYTTDEGIAKDYSIDFCKKFLSYLNLTWSYEPRCEGNIQPIPLLARTSDGMEWYFRRLNDKASINSGIYNFKFIVDVNGSRGPNCMVLKYNHATASFPVVGHKGYDQNDSSKCPNPDTFLFGINYEGKIMVGNSSWAPDSVYEPIDLDIMSNPVSVK